jgi:UDP-N-acetylmuramate dehydrogenase
MMAQNVSLSRYTTFGLGGPCRELLEVTTERDLIEAIRGCDEQKIPTLLIGGGSNLVVADTGFDGRVILVRTTGISHQKRDSFLDVTAHAGEPWDRFVESMVEGGFAGVECLSGIPGLVGATPIQNVGAYGQEVADTVRSVRVYDRTSCTVETFSREQCGFAYRDSVFKSEHPGRYVVLAVTFSLQPGGRATVRYGELSKALAAQENHEALTTVRSTVLALRRAKNMVLEPGNTETQSAGSFFTNVIVDTAQADEVEVRARALGVLKEGEVMPRFAAGAGKTKLAAGWLIERAGITKGTRHGSVAVASKHALALVHHGGGTTRELLQLATLIRSRVREVLGVTLTPEPVMVGCSLTE